MTIALIVLILAMKRIVRTQQVPPFLLVVCSLNIFVFYLVCKIGSATHTAENYNLSNPCLEKPYSRRV